MQKIKSLACIVSPHLALLLNMLKHAHRGENLLSWMPFEGVLLTKGVNCYLLDCKLLYITPKIHQAGTLQKLYDVACGKY